MTWQEKQTKMMEILRSDLSTTPDRSCEFPLNSANTVFANEWDFNPKERVKTTEGHGVICPFEMEIPSSSNFTGVLKPGKKVGIARLSAETHFFNPLTPLFHPAIALKIFRY